MKSYNQLEPAIFPVQMEPNEFWEGHTTQKHPLGSVFKDTRLGTEWVFVEFSEDLTRGLLVQPPADVAVDLCATNADAVTGPDGETYATAQVITPGTSPAWLPGVYAGCLGIVDAGTGIGQGFRIRTNTVTSLYLEEALGIALAVGDSDITILNQGLYKDVIKAANNIMAPALGSVQVTIVAATTPYGWILRKGAGYGILTTTSGAVVGSLVTPSTTAGELLQAPNTTTVPENIVGQLLTYSSADADECIVNYRME